VIAQSLALPAMKKPSEFFSDFSMPGFSEQQLPEITFDKQVTLYRNGEQISILSLTAHSEGDSIVYFHGSHVLHMGDNFFPETTKRIYPGQNAKGYFETFGPFLSSLPDDATVISGHAAAVPISKLRTMYRTTEEIYRFVVEQSAAKKSLDEIKKIGESKGFPADWIEFFHKQISTSN
jgi:glyoxylase-like metal-dependent hydrolase (beta-lactamase superfamily II)